MPRTVFVSIYYIEKLLKSFSSVVRPRRGVVCIGSAVGR